MAMPSKRYRYPSPMDDKQYRYKMLDRGISIKEMTCGVLNHRLFVWREKGSNIMEVIEKTDDLRYDNLKDNPYFGYMMRRRIYNPSPYGDEYGGEYESESYEAEYKKGTRGPCWKGYTYVGPAKYSKGSCVKNAEEYESQYTPSQELSDYTLGDLAGSSAIEGYEPLKYSVVGNRAESEPPKTSKGLIVYPQRMAELIRDGDKTLIVKDKPLDLAGKRFTIVAKRKGYAYVQLGNMRVLTLPKFRDLRDEHLITAKERAQYFKGKRRLFGWPVKVLREFDKPYPTNAPLRPQDVAPKLKTYATETFEAISHNPKYRPTINELQWNEAWLANRDFLDEHYIGGGILNRSDWELIDWSNPHPVIQKRKQNLIRQESLAKRRRSRYRMRQREKERIEEMEAEVIY